MFRFVLIILLSSLGSWSSPAQTIVNRDNDERFSLPDPPPSSVFESGWTTVEPQTLLSLARQGDPQAQVYARWLNEVAETEKEIWMEGLHRQLDSTAWIPLAASSALAAFNAGDISVADYRAVLEKIPSQKYPRIDFALATLNAGGGPSIGTDLGDTTWLVQQSESGNVIAMKEACALAVTSEYLVVEFLSFCQTLAKQGDSQAAWQMAKVYLARSDDFKADLAPRVGDIFKIPRDVSMAITFLQQAAKDHHAGAQARLAHLKAIGYGTAKDDIEAARLAQASATQNHAEGLTILGLLTQQGRGGLKPNPDTALALITQGAKRGNRMAQYSLVTLLLRGQGIERNFGEALMWLALLKLDSRHDPEPDAYGDLLLEPWPRTVTVASIARSPAADLEALRQAVILRQDLAQKGLWPL